MKFGLFQTPFTRPDRSARDGFRWAVDQGIAADQAGIDEFWVGQHFTIPWEPIPNPELVLASTLRETERITVVPGAHVLPYQHPSYLAAQTAWLSNIAEGRYLLGVATGVTPLDARLFGHKDLSENFAMTVESLDIMEKIWSGEPFEYVGKYWSATVPDNLDRPMRSLRPWGGTMPVAIGGASPNSTSIALAGARGLMPLSFGASPELIANHWQTYLKGAEEAGHEPLLDRRAHRVTMDVFVADTDAEAERIASEGPIAAAWKGHLIPNEQSRAKRAGVEPVWDANADMIDIVRRHMVVGSPDTVVEKLNDLVDRSGGWGMTLIFGHDFMNDPAPWNHSLELLATEVGPKVGIDVH